MKHIVCSSFGHDYSITKHVTDHVKEYQCKRCKIRVTNNSFGKLTKLTEKQKDINVTLEAYFNKRKARKSILNPQH